MKNVEHRCAECGCVADYTVSDSLNSIFRMEEVYFPCGAVLTESHVDRWQARNVLHKGCQANGRTISIAGMPVRMDNIHNCS